jgi:hypothetical protein
MRFKPVYLGFADRTVRKSHSGDALHFPPTTPAVSALQIASDVHTPACCNGLNSSNLAKDLKCCRRPLPLMVTDLCRACSPLDLFKFKRGQLLCSHCTPSGSDMPPNDLRFTCGAHSIVFERGEPIESGARQAPQYGGLGRTPRHHQPRPVQALVSQLQRLFRDEVSLSPQWCLG